jgi:hypothetical protein
MESRVRAAKNLGMPADSRKVYEKDHFSFLFLLLTVFVLSVFAGRPITAAIAQVDPPANTTGPSDSVQFTPAEIQAVKGWAIRIEASSLGQ